MTEQKELVFTDEELDKYRMGNYVVMTLLPMRFLHKQNISIKEYGLFLGETLSVTWRNYKGAPLSTIAKMIAMNYAAAGATGLSYIETEKGLTINLGKWPNQQFLQALGMNKAMVDDFNYVWETIGKYLGLNFELETTELGYILKFTK